MDWTATTSSTGIKMHYADCDGLRLTVYRTQVSRARRVVTAGNAWTFRIRPTTTTAGVVHDVNQPELLHGTVGTLREAKGTAELFESIELGPEWNGDIWERWYQASKAFHA